jgi:DNA processing protein
MLERYGSPEAVLEQIPEKLADEGLLTPKLVGLFQRDTLLADAERQLRQAIDLNVTILTLEDQRYPPSLHEIFAPPPVLYVRGEVSVLQRHAVAVVGARLPTVYGKRAASLISEELVEQQFVIVSGLARGIDTAAHESALRAGGKTVAVLGSGVDAVYPRSNVSLADKIMQNGCLISEFPFETIPEPFNFPRRNRIISGCSAAVVVVEAGERSGSLITARYALQQGREVGAVPGPIYSPLSRGTFDLIRQGAVPVRSGRELAEGLQVIVHPGLKRPEKKELPETLFTEEERAVLEALPTDTPVRIDTIAEQNNLRISDLFVLLLNLELKGLVQQCSGQQFLRVSG